MHFASTLSVVVAAIVGVVAADAAAAGGVAAAASETIIYRIKNTPICCSAYLRTYLHGLLDAT